MPIVRVYLDKKKIEPPRFDEMLFWALREIVPVAFYSEQGPLEPGEIDYIVTDTPSYGRGTDILIDIEAMYYEDREATLNPRLLDIRTELKHLFPDYKVSVWAKLVRACWSSDVGDGSFVSDDDDIMNMAAAVRRAKVSMLEHS